MQTLFYPTSKYVVLHGHANAPYALITYDPPSKISTGQPNVEPFDDAQAAIDRAIALGVPPLLTTEFWPHDKSFNLVTRKLVDLEPITDWDATVTYQPGAVVRHTVSQDGEDIELTFLKISDAHPSVPDLTYDLEAGTGDWVGFAPKDAPLPPPEPTAEQKIAALEARLAALEAA